MAPAKRPLAEIIEQLRTAVANQALHMVLLQTQDVTTLLDAAATALPPVHYSAHVTDELGRSIVSLRGKSDSDFHVLRLTQPDAGHQLDMHLTHNELEQLRDVAQQGLNFHAEYE